MPALLMSILTGIVGVILKKLSPIVKEALDNFLDGLEAKANTTKNTVDNMLVDFLRELLQPDGDPDD